MTDKDAHSLPRGSLQLTFRLLRAHHPELALRVRNLTENSTDNAELFRVRLEPTELTRIIQALTGEIDLIADKGMQIVARSLLEDWLELAKLP